MDMGKATVEVTVVRVDGDEFAATECGRCAALIREDHKDKHAALCGKISLLDAHAIGREFASALNDTAKRGAFHGRTRP